MYLIYNDEPDYLGYCTDSKTWTRKPKVSDVIKAFSLGTIISNNTELYTIIHYATNHNLSLVYVYDENLKEIPVTTFINDNPELFI